MKTAFSERTNEDIYLEYVNEWITVSAMAENYGRTKGFMNKIINKGRKEHLKKLK